MSKKKKPTVAPPPEVRDALDRLNERAAEVNMTRAEISRKTGIHPAHVTTTLGGKKGLSVESLARYAKSLGIALMPKWADGLPVIGTVAAGEGADEPAEPGKFVHIHQLLGRADGAYEVRGFSMADAGIRPGDVLAVRSQEDAANGDIVIAWVRDKGMVVKRLRVKDNRRYLWPEDGTGTPIVMGEGDEIRGILVGIIRTFTPPISDPPAKAAPPKKKKTGGQP